MDILFTILTFVVLFLSLRSAMASGGGEIVALVGVVPAAVYFSIKGIKNRHSSRRIIGGVCLFLNLALVALLFITVFIFHEDLISTR